VKTDVSGQRRRIANPVEHVSARVQKGLSSKESFWGKNVKMFHIFHSHENLVPSAKLKLNIIGKEKNMLGW